MLIEFPILTYIVLLPAVGAVFTLITGSDRAAKAVALTFSLVVLGLSTVLLTGFLWTNVISLPTMTTVGNHTYFAVEESPWVPSLNVNYILGADELSVVLVFLNALLTPLALAIGWDEHHRIPAFIATTPIPAGTIGDLMFVALLIAFGTKLPTWPLHTWLPDAHVEAPTGGSVILAGILLKLGGYGLIRFNVQMIPQAAIDMYWLLALAGVISILYGAVVCLAQDDLKRLVAFSSVSHLGFVAEFSVFIGVYAAFGLLVFVPILTVVLTAAYYIWAMQRAIFGPLNPKWEAMPDLHRFEVAPLAVLVASFAVFGIAPILFLSFLSNWAQGILGGL